MAGTRGQKGGPFQQVSAGDDHYPRGIFDQLTFAFALSNTKADGEEKKSLLL